MNEKVDEPTHESVASDMERVLKAWCAVDPEIRGAILEDIARSIGSYRNHAKEIETIGLIPEFQARTARLSRVADGAEKAFELLVAVATMGPSVSVQVGDRWRRILEILDKQGASGLKEEE